MCVSSWCGEVGVEVVVLGWHWNRYFFSLLSTYHTLCFTSLPSLPPLDPLVSPHSHMPFPFFPPSPSHSFPTDIFTLPAFFYLLFPHSSTALQISKSKMYYYAIWEVKQRNKEIWATPCKVWGDESSKRQWGGRKLGKMSTRVRNAETRVWGVMRKTLTYHRYLNVEKVQERGCGRE